LHGFLLPHHGLHKNISSPVLDIFLIHSSCAGFYQKPAHEDTLNLKPFQRKRRLRKKDHVGGRSKWRAFKSTSMQPNRCTQTSDQAQRFSSLDASMRAADFWSQTPSAADAPEPPPIAPQSRASNRLAPPRTPSIRSGSRRLRRLARIACKLITQTSALYMFRLPRTIRKKKLGLSYHHGELREQHSQRHVHRSFDVVRVPGPLPCTDLQMPRIFSTKKKEKGVTVVIQTSLATDT
jgi:hypothetical protein